MTETVAADLQSRAGHELILDANENLPFSQLLYLSGFIPLFERNSHTKKQTFNSFETPGITDKISGSTDPAFKRNSAPNEPRSLLAFLDDDSYPRQIG